MHHVGLTFLVKTDRFEEAREFCEDLMRQTKYGGVKVTAQSSEIYLTELSETPEVQIPVTEEPKALVQPPTTEVPFVAPVDPNDIPF